jgi:hypothetical protein
MTSGSRRLWAAMMLARTVDVLDSIVAGRPVLVRLLDEAALERALRGRARPSGKWLDVSDEMLDAIAEGGPFAE